MPAVRCSPALGGPASVLVSQVPAQKAEKLLGRRQVGAQARMPRRLLGVLAPLLDLEQLVEQGGREGVMRRQRTALHGEPEHERARGRHRGVQPDQAPVVQPFDGCAKRPHRDRVLNHRHDTGRRHQPGIVLPLGPVEPRLPRFGLPYGERFRRDGTIAEQVRPGVAHGLGHRIEPTCRHQVDHGRGQPGEAHRVRVDPVLLRVPFRGNSLGKFASRHNEHMTRRRPHGLPVEQNREAVALRSCLDITVEAAQRAQSRGTTARSSAPAQVSIRRS